MASMISVIAVAPSRSEASINACKAAIVGFVKSTFERPKNDVFAGTFNLEGGAWLKQVATETTGNPPVIAEVPPAHARLSDSPFYEEFFYAGELRLYADLKPYMRRVSRMVFFARPFETMDDLEKNIGIMFQFGRSSRGAIHKDIVKHQDSTKTPSGYFQTTRIFRIALGFMNKAPLGVVYVIDPRGAEVLDIDQFSEGKYEEGEVVFAQTLNPRRIQGALIYRQSAAGKMFVESVVLNPNYEAPEGR
ncbi:MAG TPA: hypothetical protein VM432_14325 [Bdellovibrionales bacterium]|nr:hypothetical protein [Bdellovibrionales bacterium]